MYPSPLYEWIGKGQCRGVCDTYVVEYRILFSYFLTLPVFVALDLLYSWYFDSLSSGTNWYALAAFYVVFVLGLYYFAVYQGFSRQSLPVALICGALFGFFMYATYGFATLSGLPGFPPLVIFLDMVRGAALSGVTAVAGYYINQAVMSA